MSSILHPTAHRVYAVGDQVVYNGSKEHYRGLTGTVEATGYYGAAYVVTVRFPDGRGVMSNWHSVIQATSPEEPE